MPKSGQAWNQHFLLGHPLFDLFEPWARQFRGPSWPTLDDYTAAVAAVSDPTLTPLSFRPGFKKPRRYKRSEIDLTELYDGRIALKGEVPCLSESYHDLFNVLVFCAFPRTKRALHARQFRALQLRLEQTKGERAAARLPERRSREQDALTLFDEGGVVLCMTRHYAEEWRTEPERRHLVPGQGGVVPVLFGHALMEHLLEPGSLVRAGAVVVVVPDQGTLCNSAALLERIDAALEARLNDPEEFTRPSVACGVELDTAGELWFGPPTEPWRVKLAGAQPSLLHGRSGDECPAYRGNQVECRDKSNT